MVLVNMLMGILVVRWISSIEIDDELVILMVGDK